MSDNLLTAQIRKIVHDMRLADAKFTEDQFAEAVRQAVLAGDFIKYVMQDFCGEPGVRSQAVCYVPYAEKQRLERRVAELEKEVEDWQNEALHLSADIGNTISDDDALQEAAKAYANEPNSVDEFTVGAKMLMWTAFKAGAKWMVARLRNRE